MIVSRKNGQVWRFLFLGNGQVWRLYFYKLRTSGKLGLSTTKNGQLSRSVPPKNLYPRKIALFTHHDCSSKMAKFGVYASQKLLHPKNRICRIRMIAPLKCTAICAPRPQKKAKFDVPYRRKTCTTEKSELPTQRNPASKWPTSLLLSPKKSHLRKTGAIR